ncbi:MAG TPA: S46 family peptidase [Bryobacteraceae bacterium]|nr:S46 family peptidase [Bryobacteraceae bacterium]
MRSIKLHLGLVLPVVVLAAFLRADEGMWTFNNFPSDVVAQRYGFRPDTKWLDHVRLSTARIAGGCSSGFVSANGLVMTNHHCAVGCVQDLSTPQNDMVTKGFYAKSQAQELKCPNTELNRLIGISDVTARVNDGTRGRTDQEFTDALNAEKAKITRECTTGDDVLCEVVSLYGGGRYDLYKYRRYQDVRLVFAPEKAIAFFGGDPDNFMFPRYDLDVSFLRAWENGRPAKTEHYFRWSREGAKDGMLTFVVGNPGTTEREHTVAELEFLRDRKLPDYLLYLSELRGILTQFQTKGAEQARISSTMLFSVENSIKAYRGEHAALTDNAAFGRRAEREREFRRKIKNNPRWTSEYAGAWDALAEAVRRERSLATPYLMIEKNRGFRSRLYTLAKNLVRAAEELPKPNEKRLPEFTDAKLPELREDLFSPAPIYNELQIETLTFSLTRLREELGPDDAFVRELLGRRSPREVAAELVNRTQLKDVAFRRKLFEGGKAAITASGDPMIRFAQQVDIHARAIRTRYEREVEGVLKKNHELLGRARFAVYGTSLYPDATFTPRVSWGAVRGWEENGRRINPFTIVGGVYERHTGRDPFALPDSWLQAKGRLDQTTPFNFVTTNDIIGGNSGSPMINQNAEIVGLIFDGNIHSLGGAFWFDETVNRAVAVHSQIILDSLDKVYGAQRVLDEIRPPAK